MKDSLIKQMLIYVCARLRIFFKFGCKDSKKFSYTQVFRRKSLGKVYFGGKNGRITAEREGKDASQMRHAADEETMHRCDTQPTKEQCTNKQPTKKQCPNGAEEGGTGIKEDQDKSGHSIICVADATLNRRSQICRTII